MSDQNERERRRVARNKYKPTIIKILFIAEAPPIKPDAYFYFENMTKGDSFYLETMNALYGHERKPAKCLRKYKSMFLNRFKNDGFHLIDACDVPLRVNDNRMKQIKDNLRDLKRRISEIYRPDAKIVLILSTVYRVCLEPLKAEGFNIINTEFIPFPGNGQQKKFREKLRRLLFEKTDYKIPSPEWMPSDCWND